MFGQSDLIGGQWKRLEPMSVAQFVNIKEHQEWGQFAAGRSMGKAQISHSTFWRDKSKKWATDDDEHHFKLPLNISLHKTFKIKPKNDWKFEKK